MTAGAEEPNGLVTVGAGAHAEPNIPATQVELFDGLTATSQNCWPSRNFDLMRLNSFLSPIFVAGFYYKTFMWPAALWERLYEPLIRRAAGLGELSGRPDPDTYDSGHLFADLLIIGAGPAGLSAALAASRTGARVLLVEEADALGGRLLAERHEIKGQPCTQWVTDAEARLRARPNVSILTRTSIFGAYDGGIYGAVEHLRPGGGPSGTPRQRYWKIAATKAIVAMGAVERPIAFGGNDRPGVMMASAVQAYANRYGVLPQGPTAVFATGDSGHQVAEELAALGAQVLAVIDPRPEVPATGLRVIRGEVVATHGKTLKSIEVRLADGSRRSLKADLLAVAGGWNPAVGLANHRGVRPVWSDQIQSFVIDTPPPGMHFAGAAAGRMSLGEALASGHSAALAALQQSFGKVDSTAPSAANEASRVSAPYIVAGCRQKAFVDFQHDVTVDDVELAEREGYRSVEHLKRYTTLGMATDQGKSSQVLGHAVLARRRGCDIAQVGTIAARPPHSPITIGALAAMHCGQHLRPTRLSATHQWACEQNASFVDAGLWKRPEWFTAPGDADWLASATREARTVRACVGLSDVSTLGKIELRGSDAAALLDRLYVNIMSTLPVGKCRYGLMLREDGFVFDDGTVARLGEEHYVITTTTANAVAVMRHIDFALQVTWPELDCQAISVTEQWTQLAVAGPQSRAVLQRLLPELELSNAAFPFMAASVGEWGGHPLRLFRLSFSGELAYEVAVPATAGDALVRAVHDLVRDAGGVPYGLEALNILRIEKGHVAGGELNGQVTAADFGFARMCSTKKDYIGRVLGERPALRDPERQQLVGLKPVNREAAFTAGSHLLKLGAAITADNDEGHVTSVCMSPAIGSWIGLGLLAGGSQRIGERIVAASPVRDQFVEVEVCSPVFFDPEGARLRG
jgi:sarcosine oxidase subunit alpha